MNGMAPQQQQAPQQGAPAPQQGAPAPQQANDEAVVVENLNVAQAAGLEAAQAAARAPGIGDETVKKIETGTVMLAEAQAEVSQAQAAPAGGEAPTGGAPQQ